jgi:23S rRNA pseudouridine1911/1915/1917 synthase
MSTRSKRGKPAKTIWKVLKRYGMVTLIEARLTTGRTHQIRVHFSALGHPVLGDRTYGRKSSLRINQETARIQRQMLHAECLGIEHPATGQWLEFHAPLPDDMADLILKLKLHER